MCWNWFMLWVIEFKHLFNQENIYRHPNGGGAGNNWLDGMTRVRDPVVGYT
jgi:hypothetical protein